MCELCVVAVMWQPAAGPCQYSLVPLAAYVSPVPPDLCGQPGERYYLDFGSEQRLALALCLPHARLLGYCHACGEQVAPGLSLDAAGICAGCRVAARGENRAKT